MTNRKTYLDCIVKLTNNSSVLDFRLNDRLLLELGELAPMEFDGNDTDYLIWESDPLMEHLRDTTDPTIWSLLVHQLEYRGARPVLTKMAAAIAADTMPEQKHPREIDMDKAAMEDRARLNKKFAKTRKEIDFTLNQLHDDYVERELRDDSEVAA